MATDMGVPAAGAPMGDPALTGASDPDSPEMNQDIPQQDNPYVSQQPLQFMGKGGRSLRKRESRYIYRPPFAFVDVGIR